MADYNGFVAGRPSHKAYIPEGWTKLSDGKCADCGGRVDREDYFQHNNFHANFNYFKNGAPVMSHVAWCDPGDHAYKAGVEGSLHFEGRQVVDGEQVSVEQDACPEHNPYAPAKAKETAQLKRLTREAETELSDHPAGYRD